ncbi:hypothetical protein Aple_024870 [Acrocarpospora pleiomorpha]|uniref:Uncharacterized protein n=1 Tax=Acrocarpospora pleiomorpha TaxID=90975 RepID=A0A5M3XIT1_9ACTN|nr:WD40 repeat domain-containing protein [Acrocarpospora pleiomorpha]GES19591.1 hypothetical protein Aple_024870 [Acrocarpospora pleiomorpha]
MSTDDPARGLLYGDVPVTPGQIERICADLVGPAQPLAGLIRELVAAGDVHALRLLHQENTPLHVLLDELLPADYPISDENLIRRLGPPFTDGSSSAVHAVRSAAGLARSLLEENPDDGYLRASLQWCMAAHTSPLTLDWAEPEDHQGLSRQLATLSAFVNDDRRCAGTALTVAVTLRFLTGFSPRKGPSASLNVLFNLGSRGLKARLTGTLIPSWPPGLVPDPRRMTLFTADQDFQLALTRAWAQAGKAVTGTVIWSIEAEDGPIGTVVGESLGAAFAVMIDELRRRHRPFYRNPAVFRLVGTNAVVGRIDDWGNLQSVEGYAQKLEAVGGNARVIVPTVDEQKANEAGRDVLIVPAPNWAIAANKARRPDFRPIAQWAVAPLVVVLIIAGLAVLNRQQAVGAHQQEVMSRQTSQRSDELLERDPVLSGLLSAAAWRFAPTDEARYGMLAATATAAETVLQWHPLIVHGVAYSPDGSTLASIGGGSAIQLWDAATRRVIGSRSDTDRFSAYGLAFSPRGDLLATSDDRGSIRLWTVPGLTAIGGPLNHGSSTVPLVAFDRGGATLVTAGRDGAVRTWDVAARRPSGKPFTIPRGSSAVALSRDGRTLATTVGESASVQLWDLSTRRRLGAPLSGGRTVEFSGDGKRLAVVGDDGMRVWGVRTRRPIGKVLKGPATAFTQAAFSSDGATLAAAGSDGSIQLWDIATGEPVGNPLRGHTAIVIALAFDPHGGSLASAGADGTSRLWDLSLFRPAGKPLSRHAGLVAEVVFSPDGAILASGSWDGTARLWDTATRLPVGDPLNGHDGQINTVAFSPDGRTLVTAGNDRTIRRWDVATQRPIGPPIMAHLGAVLDVTFSPDGHLLASSGDDGATRLWDAATGRAIRSPLLGHWGPVNYVNAVAFSPDGRTLATAGVDITVRLWDAATGQPVGDPLEGGYAINNVDFSPEGEVLAAAQDDGTVQLWDPATHETVGDPIGVPGSSLWGLAFSPDGTILATGAGDGSARLWDVATRRPLGGPLRGHGKGFTDVTFSPDGTILASAGEDGRVLLWNVAMPKDPFRAVCAIAGRSLTREEWRRYVPGEPFGEVCP